ncbi:MAG: ABC transporter ATP-binding protein [bacterium]|nr:ABC transporter ATP-binding protein [bacterium]
MESILKIEKLTKRFGDVRAVDTVSFEIEKGKIFALIGPNGSGKTTMIRTIAGLLAPSDGTVMVAGENVVTQPIRTKQSIGYIPDEPAIWAGMTGEEFLHFTGTLFGMEEKERLARVKELLGVFHLSGIEKNYFEDYSRGNKQKFSIMSALMHRPSLLLIDEPIVGLDPTSAEIAKAQFVAHAKNGGAVLIATHTLPVAQEIADTIGVLKSGELVASDTMEGLRKKAHLLSDASLEEVYKALAT